MSHNNCVIYDSDETYAKRLMSTLNDSEDFTYNAQVFTDKDNLIDYLKDVKIELLMINEETYEYYCENNMESAKKIVVLCEDSEDMNMVDSDVLYECKYQPTNELIKRVSNNKIKNKRLNETKIMGVVGMNNSERLVLSLGLAKYYSKKGQTLFVSLEEFAGLSGILSDNRMNCLSDALYYFKQNKMQYCEKIGQCINKDKGLDYISPVMCAEDISYIGVEDLVLFFQLLGKELGYAYIVIDMGNGVKSPWNLYAVCDKLFMPKVHNYFDKARELSMVTYMNETGMNSLLDNYREVLVDLSEDCMNEDILNRIEYSRTFARIKEVADGR
ncbi:hypothetical protein [Lachnospira multipara]|uniref:hypothetical protein n=1 Tax=Lachnospira multipara TaxID=28051 RepID=UPI0004E28992|nr:hypothetical protein [Lachnospira multipara]